MTTDAYTPPAVTRSPGLSALVAPLGDTAALAWRNLIAYRRAPQLIIAATVQPVLTVLLFTYIFGGAIAVPGLSYTDFLLPGVFGWTVVIGAQGAAVGLAADFKSGFVERLRSLPMSPAAYLAGRCAGDLVRNLFVVVLVTWLGVAVGFHVHSDPLHVAAGVMLVLLFGYAATWLFAWIGLSVGDPESAQAATFPPMVLLVFSSTAFVPAETMPSWLQIYVRHQPLSAVLAPTRALILGGPVARPLIEALAWIAGLMLVFGPLALNRYREAFA
jgi:ABC transporter DrrB family efflux protein